MDARTRLIFALDVASAQEAVDLVRILASEVGIFKVGLELFVAQGPAILDRLRQAGAAAIFLDLKLHDIPATMRGAAKSAAGLGVDLLTCHAEQPGIFTGLDLGGLKILGVTALTSLGPEDLERLGYRPELTDPSQLVAARIRLALEAGCHGVVCSGREAAQARAILGPQGLVICPGIRPPGAEVGDQKRVMTPAEAMAAGASHLVVGRPIRQAPDPAAAARLVCQGIAQGLAQRQGA